LASTNDPGPSRLRRQRELFFQPLLEALNYPNAPQPEAGTESAVRPTSAPALAEVPSIAKGEPGCGLVECLQPRMSPTDAARISPSTGGRSSHPKLGLVLPGEAWEAADQAERVFGQELPPALGAGVSRDQACAAESTGRSGPPPGCCVLSSSPCWARTNPIALLVGGHPAGNPRAHLPRKGARQPLLVN